jgi:hypothetical protein
VLNSDKTLLHARLQLTAEIALTAYIDHMTLTKPTSLTALMDAKYISIGLDRIPNRGGFTSTD